MQKKALLALRIGLGITFLWIGVRIYLAPSIWASAMLPWTKHIVLFGSLKPLMMIASAVDVVLGLLLLAGLWTWIAAFLGVIAFLIAFAAKGFTDVTVGNAGLIGALLAVFFLTAPQKWLRGGK